MRIDSITGNVFGVTRSFGSTTATVHAENAQITNLSELIATLTTDRAHGLINGDFVEVFGDQRQILRLPMSLSLLYLETIDLGSQVYILVV